MRVAIRVQYWARAPLCVICVSSCVNGWGEGLLLGRADALWRGVWSARWSCAREATSSGADGDALASLRHARVGGLFWGEA